MKKFRKIFRLLGPGFITGASDDDPSGIATYSQTGAQFGYTQLWTPIFSFPFMTVIQEMCGRIGMVTGKGLAGVIRHHYPKPILYTAVLILLVANTVNIGANLGAMAMSAQLIFGFPFIVWILLFTIVILVLEIFLSYNSYAKILKYLTFSLFAYIVTAFFVKQDWVSIFSHTFIPRITFDEAHIVNLVALLGTTISPYLFFWQATEEVEEEVHKGKLHMYGKGIPKVNKGDIKEMRIDTFIGMFFSNLVMFFIIMTAGSTLFRNGIYNVDTADQAARALQPFAGDWAFLLFAAGIIGTGMLSVPVLSGGASYAISEAFGWRAGLYEKIKKAHGFYGVITIATLVGLLINFTPIEPFKMLYYTAVLNGIAAPPLMVLILLIANNGKIMGTHVNSGISNILGWTITGFMFIASILLFYFMFW